MHHALYIEEILLNIFRHCNTPQGMRSQSCYANDRLTTLAGTCRAFKEPALDLIWSELSDFTPLVRWLPGVSLVESGSGIGPLYSLERPLEESEWNTILYYARRVRKFPRLRGSFGLTPACIQTLSDPPASTNSIFPNLRTVGMHGVNAAIFPLIRHLVNPTVTDISFEGTGYTGFAVIGFGSGCPRVTRLRVLHSAHRDTIFELIRHWHKLRSIICFNVALHFDAFYRLSCLHDLQDASFKLDEAALVGRIQAIQPSIMVLTFPALRDFSLDSASLSPVGALLHHIRTPALRSFSVALDYCPPAPDLMSFFASLQEATVHAPLNTLWLSGAYQLTASHDKSFHVTLDYLRPLTVFTNMKSLTLDVPYGVDLSGHDLLALASAWPHLEVFKVGLSYGWMPSSGVTPDEFVLLLERCRSLRALRFAFNANGYTEIPQGEPWRGRRMPAGSSIQLVLSPIEEASIHALGAFFHVAPDVMTPWNEWYLFGSERPRGDWDVYNHRWAEVRRVARELSEKSGL